MAVLRAWLLDPETVRDAIRGFRQTFMYLFFRRGSDYT